MKYLGIDGCKRGWFISGIDDNENWSFQIVKNLDAYLLNPFIKNSLKLVLIDIPIGLPKDHNARECEKEARKILGKKAASIFNVPVSEILHIEKYEEANRQNRIITGGNGISRQTFHIMKKIGEVNELMRNHKELPVMESHPEIIFYYLNNQNSLNYNKKKPEGRKERLEILSRYIPGHDMNKFIQDARKKVAPDLKEGALKKDVADDDIIDSIALALIAKRGYGQLKSLPEKPEKDAYGLSMQIVYWPS